jgi:hypothetical protein
MARYFLVLFTTIAIVIGGVWFCILKKPTSILEPSYSIFRAKMDLAAHLPPGSVIILGDSRPMVGLIPAQLGPDVYNLAVGGASPIEILAFARLVLSTPHPPRAVILSLAPFRCVTDEVFWENGIKFGLLDRAAVEEARIRSRQYPNDLVLGSVADDRPDSPLRSPLFGPRTMGDVEARLKANLYLIRFPSYYFASLAQGRFGQRESENRDTYREVIDTRGHKYLGTANGSRDLSLETTASSLNPSPLLDSYLSETIDLFKNKNIPVYFIGCPLNEESTAALQPGFADAFDRYIRSFEPKHPNFHVLGKTLTTLPWIDFCEAAHLNPKGAKIFSDDVAGLLRDAGIENEN